MYPEECGQMEECDRPTTMSVVLRTSAPCLKQSGGVLWRHISTYKLALPLGRINVQVFYKLLLVLFVEPRRGGTHLDGLLPFVCYALIEENPFFNDVDIHGDPVVS